MIHLKQWRATMSNKLKLDWEALAAYVTAFPLEGSILVTPESKRFTRLQRFVHRHARVRDPNKSRDAMISLAQEFQLEWFRAARLFVKLQEIGSVHRFGRQRESLERAGDFVKALEGIRVSLNRLAHFSQSLLAENARPRERITETHLEWAAHFWADGVRRESEQPGRSERWEEAVAHGFSYTKARPERGSRISRRGDGEYRTHVVPANYDSLSVVRTWLHNNVLFSELVANIIKEKRGAKSDETPQSNEQAGQPTAVERLVGVSLPALYSLYTGRSFYPSRGGGNKVLDTGGVRFVRMAMAVMRLQPLSPETIHDHWEAAQEKLGG